jgi:hypothetical protein
MVFIQTKNISKIEKENLMMQQQALYFQKAQIAVLHYFKILEQKKYDDAYNYLRGTSMLNFNGLRLSSFFTLEVLGHLEIFINSYKLRDELSLSISK